MTAYAVIIREETIDPSELDAYAARVAEIRPALDRFLPEVLAGYGAQEVIEGVGVEGVAIVKFPTYELAMEWYRSPEYQSAVGHRLRGARYHSIIVNGIDPPA